MNNSLLENPIWNSLRTDHAHLAEGDDCARRYPHEIGPLAGIPDQSESSYNSLRSLAGDYPVVLFSRDLIQPTRDWSVIRSGRLVQMVRTANASTTPAHKPISIPPDTSGPTPPPANPNSVPSPSPQPVAPSSHAGGSTSCAATLDPPCTLRQLTLSDAADMVVLAALTEPGPFRLRTIELGNFYGIFQDDRLVSMAGKRMHIPGFVEVSGVCTHPDARGRGHARTLMQIVIDEIEQSGRTPFLHAWHDNPATRLYQSLGFTLSHNFNLAVLSAQ